MTNFQPNATVHAGGGLNIRRGPGRDHEVTAALLDRARIAVESASGDWWGVDTPLGRGFVHRDFVRLDAGVGPPPEAPATPAEHTVAAGETLSRIAARYGLEWRDIASLNALANPDVLSVGQVLRLPVGAAAAHTIVEAAAEVASAMLVVGDPLSADGSAIVTSSSANGHHCPFGGTHSADLDVLGVSQGAEVRFQVACASVPVRGVVERIAMACRSGVLADGGHSLTVNIERLADGTWERTGAWLLYAHLDPVLVGVGDVVAPGHLIGRLGPPEGPEYRSRCATASHVHVEVNRAGQVMRSGGACGESLMTVRL